MRFLVMAMAAVALLTGCSMSKDIPIADKAIDHFHQQLNAGQFDAIYAASDDAMKKVTSQPNFDQMLAAVHRKLGIFKSGKAVGWNDSITPNGHLLTLNYVATYERAPAEESFIYRMSGDQSALAGYHVNSQAFLLN